MEGALPPDYLRFVRIAGPKLHFFNTSQYSCERGTSISPSKTQDVVTISFRQRAASWTFGHTRSRLFTVDDDVWLRLLALSFGVWFIMVGQSYPGFRVFLLYFSWCFSGEIRLPQWECDSRKHDIHEWTAPDEGTRWWLRLCSSVRRGSCGNLCGAQDGRKLKKNSNLNYDFFRFYTSANEKNDPDLFPLLFFINGQCWWSTLALDRHPPRIDLRPLLNISMHWYTPRCSMILSSKSV